MAQVNDISIGAIDKEDYRAQIDSLVRQVNENFRRVANEDRTKIINDDAGTQRLLMGYQEGGFTNGNVGVKLSQEGSDVTTASAGQLIFSSDLNLFKVVGTGIIDAPRIEAGDSTPTSNQIVVNTGIESDEPLVVIGTKDGTILPLFEVLEDGTFAHWAKFSTYVSGGFVWVQLDYVNYYGLGYTPGNIKYYVLAETSPASQ